MNYSGILVINSDTILEDENYLSSLAQINSSENIGANSIVTSNVDSNVLVAGSPAKIINER